VVARVVLSIVSSPWEVHPNAFSSESSRGAVAATALAVLPVVILYAFMQRSIVQGIMEGALKN
jgi:ABC-type glycerol-3-phosphate transport system permease component